MESVKKNPDTPVWFAPYANIRAESYLLLASLLGRQPSERIKDLLQNLQWPDAIPEKLDYALRELHQAGCDYPQAVMEDEFNRLFVGLGNDAMVPYASWYRERKIQSKPLAFLRSDLIRLGIVKQEGSHEPEDHACVLCEVMSIISGESGGAAYATQARFFQQHIAPWMKKFFRDLQSAKNAEFYRAVGSFGIHFLELESEYLKYAVSAQPTKQKGGSDDENENFLRPAGIH